MVGPCVICHCYPVSGAKSKCINKDRTFSLCLGQTLTQESPVLGNRLQIDPTFQNIKNSHVAGFFRVELIQYSRRKNIIALLPFVFPK